MGISPLLPLFLCEMSSSIRSNIMENGIMMGKAFCGYMGGVAQLPLCFSAGGKRTCRICVYCSEDKSMLHPYWMESSVINLPPNDVLYLQEMVLYLGISAGLNC